MTPTQLLALLAILQPALKLAEATIATKCGRQSNFFALLRAGRDCRTRTAAHVAQCFSDNWPVDLAWPADIARPAPTVIDLPADAEAA
jgi:hypothetical protein